jgi:hypothetical protein
LNSFQGKGDEKNSKNIMAGRVCVAFVVVVVGRLAVGAGVVVRLVARCRSGAAVGA